MAAFNAIAWTAANIADDHPSNMAAAAPMGLWQGAIVRLRTHQATALLVAPPIAADLAPADFTCWSQRLEAQRSMMKRLGGTTGCSISRPPAAASFPGWIGEATG